MQELAIITGKLLIDDAKMNSADRLYSHETASLLAMLTKYDKTASSVATVEFLKPLSARSYPI